MCPPPEVSHRGDPLESIVDHAHSGGHGFAVLAVGLDGADSTSPAAASECALALLQAEHGVEEAAARLATLEGGETIGLMTAVLSPGADVVALGSAVAHGLHDLIPVSIGVSTSVGHPRLSLDDATAVALEGLDVARSSGSDDAVHTELYELVLRSAHRPRVRAGAELEPVVLTPRATDDVDDPFAHMAADPPSVALDPTLIPTPARDRAALSEEVERLRREKDHLADEDRSARDVLERRIAKLMDELERAEDEIGRLRAARDADPGLSSIYREVQGLDASAPLAPVKRRLVEGVFRANAPSDELSDDSSSTASRQ